MATTGAEMKCYGGADLRGNNVLLTVCDQAGQRAVEKRVKGNLIAVKGALEPHWDRIEVMAVESTYNWYWLVDGLRAAGRVTRPTTRKRGISD